MFQCRLLRLAVSLFPQIFLVQIAVLSDGDQGIYIDLLHIGSQRVQQTHSNILALFDQCKKQMLRAGLLLSETGSLAVCLFQNPGSSGRISLFVLHGHTVFKGDQIPDHFHDLIHFYSVIRQHFCGYTGIFLQESHQNVFGPDIALFQASGTSAGLGKRILRFIRKL